MESWARLEAYRVRFEWGLAGAEAVADEADLAVVVDVLSFTTTLSVALDAGISVLPYPWKDESAAAVAAEHDAVRAVGRAQAGPGEISLSAQTIRDADPVARLVLPSPNGSAMCHRLARHGARILGASLRNAGAVATWVAAHHDPATTTLAVIAAGEQWPGGALRPAVEDLWGAGAVLHHLRALGLANMSPEATMAMASFDAARSDLTHQLRTCASGRELIAYGYAGDVGIAAEVNQSSAVPLLHDQWFMAAPAVARV